MAESSAIEWTDATWNPVTGCTKVSPGCKHCYAETFAERWRGVPGHPYEQGFDLRLWPERLNLPLKWKSPRMIFVNSMSDLFRQFLGPLSGRFNRTPQQSTPSSGAISKRGYRSCRGTFFFPDLVLLRESATVERFVLEETPYSEKIVRGADGIAPRPRDDLRRRIVVTLNMSKVVQHVWEAIRFENTEALAPVFDIEHPVRSTGGMRTWFTGRPCERTRRSHINFCVFDSTWEASEAFELDRNDVVDAWVRNDHLGFEILYVYRGVVKKYWPDYLVRLKSGRMLVLEVKGQDSQENQTKREFLDEWVRAVNQHGGFGEWSWAVSRHPKDVAGILEESERGARSPEPVRA